MTSGIEIGKRCIGPGNPVYCIAEVSANHHQDFAQAVRIIEAAKQAGADAVKLQTYTADTMTIVSNRQEFRIGRRHAVGWAQSARPLRRSLHTVGVAAETQEVGGGSRDGFIFDRL